MSKITLRNYTVVGAIYCGINGPEMQAGDQVRLFLNRSANPDFPEYINGVVQLPTSRTQVLVGGCIQDATNYSFEYDTDDLDDSAPFLRPCDITEISCITCCVILREQLDELRAQVEDLPGVTGSANVGVTGGTGADDPFVVTQLTDRAVSDLTVNVAYNIGAPNAPSLSLISAINKEEGDTVVVIYDADSTPNSGDEFLVKWTITAGVLANPVILEWPKASVTTTLDTDNVTYVHTYRSKTGTTVSWKTVPPALTAVPLSDYAGQQQTSNVVLSGTVTSSGEIHIHITGALLDDTVVVSVAVENGDTSDEWGPKVLAVLEAHEAFTDLYEFTLYAGFPDPTLEMKAVDAAADDTTQLLLVDNGSSSGIDEVDSGDFTGTVGDAPVVGTPGYLGQVALVASPFPDASGSYYRKFTMVEDSPRTWRESAVAETSVINLPPIIHPRSTATRSRTSPYVLTSVSTKALPIATSFNPTNVSVNFIGTATTGTDANNPNQVRPFEGRHQYSLITYGGSGITPFTVVPADYDADTNNKTWQLESSVFNRVTAYSSFRLGGFNTTTGSAVSSGSGRSLDLAYASRSSSGGAQLAFYGDPADHMTANLSRQDAVFPVAYIAYTKNKDGLPDTLAVPGPFADDTAAAGASPTIPVGGLYYDSTGIIRRRMA